ncbi:MAG: peptidylprolyl isomerase [Actinomycetes bacterium]
MSSSNKRERELARKKYERQQARRNASASGSRRRNQILAVIAGLVVVGGAVAMLVQNSGSDPAPIAASPTPTASSSPSTAASPSTSASASASASPAALVCPQGPKPTTKKDHWASAPTSTLDAGKTYTMTLDTNCGKVVIQLDQAGAPQTAASEVFLADQGYYNLADCFRLTTAGIFVVQCGSPTNDAQNGPGYTVPDENLPTNGTNDYPAGTVAMANAGPGTAGSQFFIVYKDTTLPPSYTIWGKVVSGLDVITKVANVGVQGGGGDGKPAQPFIITKATTAKSG